MTNLEKQVPSQRVRSVIDYSIHRTLPAAAAAALHLSKKTDIVDPNLVVDRAGVVAAGAILVVVDRNNVVAAAEFDFEFGFGIDFVPGSVSDWMLVRWN